MFEWVTSMDENFQYFDRNIDEILDIGDNRSEMSHGNSFEGKIVEKSKISSIYRYRTEISASGTHTHVGDFLLQNIENISEISEISIKISKIYRDISAIYWDIS